MRVIEREREERERERRERERKGRESERERERERERRGEILKHDIRRLEADTRKGKREEQNVALNNDK
jgi:hypothetical protein